jgi:hypothetical protein
MASEKKQVDKSSLSFHLQTPTKKNLENANNTIGGGLFLTENLNDYSIPNKQQSIRRNSNDLFLQNGGAKGGSGSSVVNGANGHGLSFQTNRSKSTAKNGQKLKANIQDIINGSSGLGDASTNNPFNNS